MKNRTTHDQKRKARHEKLAKVRRKQRMAILRIGAAAAVVLVILVILFQSGLFKVTKIEITGNKILADGQILKAASPPKHTNYFTFPYKETEKKVSTLPWVSNTSVYRKFPGTIVIEVKERKPLAYIDNNGLIYIVDSKGYVITAEPFKKYKLPVISGLKIKKIVVGQKIGNEAFGAASKVLASLPKKIRNEIYSVTMPDSDQISFVVKGIEVVYGSAEDSSIKNSVINKFMNSKDSGKLSTIDIRIPTRPVVRLIGN